MAARTSSGGEEMKWLLVILSFAIGAALAWPKRSVETRTPAIQTVATKSKQAHQNKSGSRGEEATLLAMLKFPAHAKAKGYAATLSSLLGEPESMSRAIRIKQLVEAWETEDPLACLSFLVGHDKSELASGMTWYNVAKEDAPEAWELLKRSKGKRHLGPILSAVFESDPAQAASMLQAAGKLRFELADEAQDFPWPAAKLTQWLATQPNSRINAELASGMMREWSKSNPAEAADWYLAQPGKPPMLEDEAAEKLVAARPDAFAARLSMLGGRISTFEQIGTTCSLAVQRPAAVAEFINNMAPSPTRITQAWACVNEICASQGPAQGVAFALQLQSGGARLDALANAFHRWNNKDNPDEQAKRQAALEQLSPAEQAYVNCHDGDMPGVAGFLQ
jgi:hypothetical protein